MLPTSLLTLHELVAARVVALDASDYAQGDLVATWREAESPLNAMSEGDFVQHLSFSVLLERAPGTQRDRGTSGETVRVRVDFAVLFAFQLLDQAGGRLGDLKLAYSAARDVCGAVMRDWPDGDIDLINAWLPGQPADDFLPVRVEFSAGLDLDLST
jgi:hypothetical protein